MTRSEAERLLLRLLRAARLPAPRVNVKVLRFEVDFFWPDRRLIVEVDGYAFHGHRAAFERDSRRRAVLAANGYVVVPVTWRRLTEEPHAVTATIAAALAQSSSSTAGEFARRTSDSMPVAGRGREK